MAGLDMTIIFMTLWITNGLGGGNGIGPVEIVGEKVTGQSTGVDDEECGSCRPKMKTKIKIN